MKEKQHHPQELDNKKGFRKGKRKAYRTKKAVIVEEAGEVIKQIEVENPERDCTATLWLEAKA